ncbi:MAG: hypothetical protein GKR88_18065 [Flavobacteriaceae bacterium]|nr:MAG: hypothetical protein GKR88_18065 [Flavobacteriaceae bacterium]
MIDYIIIPVSLILLILLFRPRASYRRKYSFYGKSLESEIRAAERANVILAGQLRKVEQELDRLKKNSVNLAQYQKLQKECDLLEKFIKQHIEKKL